ncbi:transposase, partial [Xanthomonas oryzae pv. oryzae]
MTAKVFEAALGIGAPWSVGAVEFDEATKVLTVPVDFKPGTRFKGAGQTGVHPGHDLSYINI